MQERKKLYNKIYREEKSPEKLNPVAPIYIQVTIPTFRYMATLNLKDSRMTLATN